MMDFAPTGDDIAQRAARLIVAGRAADYADALAKAIDQAGSRPPSLPAKSLVRRHVEALRLAELGDAGVREVHQAIIATAEEIMTALDHQFSPRAIMIAGRAAKWRFDQPPVVHIRIYTRAEIGALAAALVEQGYEEPQFETANTRFGRLDRIRFVEGGNQFVLTRCLPEQLNEADKDLHTGEPIATADLEEVRRQLSSGRP